MALIVVEAELGATVPAAIGLRVEASIIGSGIFPSASWTKLKGTHRGLFAVVGDGFDDGVSRTAVYARDERMGKSSVVLLGEFLAACRAQASVWSDHWIVACTVPAGLDTEVPGGYGGYGLAGELVNSGQGWRIMPDGLTEVV